MRVVRVALAGVLALSAPVMAHSASLGSNLGQAMTGPAPGVIQVGNGSNWHPAPGGGAVVGARRIRDRTVLMAGGVPMAGRRSLITGSTFLGAQSLMIHSQIGEARAAAGVIRSQPSGRRKPAFSVFGSYWPGAGASSKCSISETCFAAWGS
jgi:hypothetical protein